MTALMAAQKSKIVSASTLAGYRVRSHGNDDLGAVEEILIEPGTGRIAYAVLCFGGALGFGDRLFPIPWDLLALNASDQTLILNCDHERLSGAPAFDQEEWPDLGDETWESVIRDYYGGAVTFTKAS